MFALALIVLGGSRTARADDWTVALVVPTDADQLIAEAATRLRAELVAAGFDVRELRAEEGTDPDVQASSFSPVATIAIVAADGTAAADMWVVDRATHETVVRHVDVSNVARRRAPSVLAVRAVELLRANLVAPGPKPAPKPEPGPKPENKPEPPKSTTAPKPKAATEKASEQEHDADHEHGADHDRDRGPDARELGRLRFGGELGAAALYGSGGVSAAFAPLLRLEYGNATWAGRLGLVMPAFGAEATASGGKATVREELATLDVALTWPASGLVGVVGSAGGGGYHWRIDGQGNTPNVGHDADRWGFVAEVGLGAIVRTSARSGIVVDTQAVWMAPPIAIQIAGVTAGRSSQPTLCTSVGFRMAL